MAMTETELTELCQSLQSRIEKLEQEKHPVSKEDISAALEDHPLIGEFRSLMERNGRK